MAGFKIFSKFHGELELQAGLPKKFNKIIPGAECGYVAHNEMYMAFQRVKVGPYDLVFSHYNGMSNSDRYSCEDDEPVIEINFNIDGKARIDLTSHDWVIFQPEYHEIMILPYVKDQVHFLTNNLENFGIHIPYAKFKLLANKFKHLRPLLKAYENKNFGFLNKKIPIKTSIKSMALLIRLNQRIERGLYDEITLELLEQLIEQSLVQDLENKPSKKLIFTYVDIEGVINFHSTLQSDLSVPVSIKILIEKSHMIPGKLRKGFKLLYDTTPYEYRQQCVYDYIYEQMKDSNYTTLSELVDMSNTKNVTEFAKQFKRYIGVDPKNLLKKE